MASAVFSIHVAKERSLDLSLSKFNFRLVNTT